VLANMIGQGWAAAVGLLLVPLYVRWLGAEGYGLIGVYATLQASLQILDLGLSQTMSREMAKYLEYPDRAGEARDFLRTLEVGYWAVGLVMGAVIVAAAPTIAARWLQASAIPAPTLVRALAIMGVVTALQWPLSFYEGGLVGLQRQVAFNVLKIAVVTFGGIGTVLVLWRVAPTVTAYFGWQVVVAGVNVGLLALLTWRSLPPSSKAAAFVPRLVRENWHFAAGMSGIAISGILLSQLDKLLLSRLLPLETFGYYALAAVVSGVVPMLVAGPVFSAVFPQLTRHSAARDDTATSLLYHRGTQLMAVLVAAVASVIAVYSREILVAWTRDRAAAEAAAPIVSVLVVGMGLNALMAMPYALQLAHGWTGLGLRINAVLIAVVVPALLLVTPRYGPVGAAAVWLGSNLLYMAIGVPLTHRRILPGEGARWVLADVVPPTLAAFAVVGGARWLLPRPSGTVITAVALALLVALAATAAGASAPLVRKAAAEWATRLRVAVLG
jgi:O-antigen/teichoic acid export membrane protein